jgi:hypothetical protein
VSRRSGSRRDGGLGQADSPPSLASGRKLEWKNERPQYTPGQLALCCALVQMPEHPFNRNKKNIMLQTVEALDLMDEQSLFCLADMIEEMWEDSRLRHRPLLSEMRRMAVAAIDSVRELNSEVTRYGLWKVPPAKPKQKQKPTHTADTVPRMLIKRPGSEPKIILQRPGERVITVAAPPVGTRCAVRISGKWYLGKVIRIYSDVDIEVRLDNSGVVSGDPHDADFRTLD